MATPAASWRRPQRKVSSGPSSKPSSAVSSSYFKQKILLYDWWLIQVNSDGCNKRLGVGGFTSRESRGIRCFSSAAIVKRCDAVTLTTADGLTVLLHGHLNRSQTLDNGFATEVCDHFVIGFPYYWEEFAVDGNKTPDTKNVYDIQRASEGSAQSIAPLVNLEVKAKRKLENAAFRGIMTRSRARGRAQDK